MKEFIHEKNTLNSVSTNNFLANVCNFAICGDNNSCSAIE